MALPEWRGLNINSVSFSSTYVNDEEQPPDKGLGVEVALVKQFYSVL